MTKRRHLPRDERGIALVLAIGIMTVLSISLVAIVSYTSANARSADRSEADQVAFTVAEGGVNQGIAVLASSAAPFSDSALPSSSSPQTVTLEGGTAQYWGSRGNNVWTITARSTVRNPSGGTEVQRTVSQQVEVQTTVADNPAWRYLYADGPGGVCDSGGTGGSMNLTSSVSLRQPVYVRGNLCMSSSANMLAAASPVNVTGGIQLTSFSYIGCYSTSTCPSAQRLAQVHVAGGCRRGTSGSYSALCRGNPHRVWAASGSSDTTIPAVSKPPLDLPARFAEAKPGPKHACTSSSGSVPAFDSGTVAANVLDRSAATVDLMPAASYDCQVIENGTVVGRLQWQTGTPGTLTIVGYAFVDGNIVLDGATTGVVSGRGTVYASGTISFDGSRQLCGLWDSSAGMCDWTNWDADGDHLALVAGSCEIFNVDATCRTQYPYGFTVTSSTRFQGSAYAVTDFQQTSSTRTQGPVIARRIDISSAATSIVPAYDILPPGAPGVSTAGNLTLVAGSFRG